MSNAELPEDLVVLARRGALSAAQQKELERVLERSSTLRIALQAGQDFDGLGSVQPGDEQWINRLVARTMRQKRQALRPWRRRSVSWLIAAAVMVTGTAAFALFGSPTVRAWLGVAEPVGEAIQEGAPPKAQAPKATRGARRVTTPQGVHAETPPAVDAEELFTAPHGAPAEPAGRAVTAPSPTPPARTATAAGLFAEAGAARRAGKQNQAVRLFQKLQREFPASREATLSHLSLGRLLLSGGNAAGALAQFTAYQRRGGLLTEEALLGQARALGALGRASEERAVWTRLLKSYPSTVYAREARARLGLSNNKDATP